MEKDNVRNPQGEDLGDVKELVIDLEGNRVRYAVIGFGGFLGMEEKLFAFPLSAFIQPGVDQPVGGQTRASNRTGVENDAMANRAAVWGTRNELVLNLEKDRLENAPGFEATNWPNFSDAGYRGGGLSLQTRPLPGRLDVVGRDQHPLPLAGSSPQQTIRRFFESVFTSREGTSMENVFFDDWRSLLRTAIVGVLAYIGLVLLLRVAGNRTLSKMNAFDLVVTVALGSTLATILLSKDVTLAQGALGLCLLVAMQFIVTWSSVRMPWVKRVVTGEPTLLFYKGAPLHGTLRRARVTEEELRAAVRAAGIAALDEVEAVVMETDGSLSVVRQSTISADARESDTCKSSLAALNTDVQHTGHSTGT